MEIFRLYDTKADAWLPIFTSHNTATAIRAVEESIAQGQAPHAEDLALYLVGFDDPDNGTIHGELNPKHIVYLRDLIQDAADADKRAKERAAEIQAAIGEVN